jgi:ferritin
MPKLSKTLCDAINEQIKNELTSAYNYLALSNQCAARNLKGSAHWLRKQWEEEIGHAMKLVDYVIERGNQVDLREVAASTFKVESLKGVFEKVLADEQQVTRDIHGLYEKALADKDYAAQALLQWFVTEQVEEENSAQEIVDTLKVVGDQGTALLMIDRQLGARA